MTKSLLRVVLAGFASAGVAAAQTPAPPLSPTSTPPAPAAPIQQVALELVPVAPVPPAAPVKLVAKVFDVADLVCPPKDSPLAKPSEDEAMKAAVAAYTEARAEQLMRTVRMHAEKDSWTECGGPGTLDFYAAGRALVVRNSSAVLDRVGECLDSLRKSKAPHVLVEMMVLSVPSEHAAVAKLFGKKREAALTSEELTKLVRDLKAEGVLEVLSRPQLMLTDNQTGFFQCGQQFPRVTGTAPTGAAIQQTRHVEYINTGLVVRLTPRCGPDGRVLMRTEVTLTEPSATRIDLGNGQKATAIDCQAMEAVLLMADGGTMAVNIGTKKVEQRIETKVPVVGDLPYIGRLFRTIGISHERRDTVVVFTAHRVTTAEQHTQVIGRQAATVPTPLAMPSDVLVRPAMMPSAPPHALPVAVPPVMSSGVLVRPVVMPTAPISVAPAPVPPATIPPFETQRRNGSPLPANAVPVAPPMVREVREIRLTAQPGTTIQRFEPPTATEGIIMTRGTPAVPGTGYNFRTVGPDGLERIGVDFNFTTRPACGSVPATGTITGATCAGVMEAGQFVALMTAYKAACAAGRKDEAGRLALQLLAKDPTCFGRAK